MDHSKVPVLGVVFNGVEDTRLAAGYEGGYDSVYASYSNRYQYGYGKDGDEYKKDYS